MPKGRPTGVIFVERFSGEVSLYKSSAPLFREKTPALKICGRPGRRSSEKSTKDELYHLQGVVRREALTTPCNITS
jgi:hypothetical protein